MLDPKYRGSLQGNKLAAQLSRLLSVITPPASPSSRRRFAALADQFASSPIPVYRQHGYPSRRRSLVGDAKFETVKNREARLTWLLEQQQSSADLTLSEEEVRCQMFTGSSNQVLDIQVLVANEVDEEKKQEEEPLKAKQTNLLLGLKEGGFGSLTRILSTVENCNGSICHLESRRTGSQDGHFDLFLDMSISGDGLLNLMKALRQGNLAEVTVLKEQLIPAKDPWFPRHVSDLDFCNHLMTQFEPDLDVDHPGFTDKVYRARRQHIAQIAFNYK